MKSLSFSYRLVLVQMNLGPAVDRLHKVMEASLLKPQVSDCLLALFVRKKAEAVEVEALPIHILRKAGRQHYSGGLTHSANRIHIIRLVTANRIRHSE